MVEDITSLDDASETKEGLEQGADFLATKIDEIEEIISEIREGTELGGTAEEWSSYSMESICEEGDAFVHDLNAYKEELEEFIAEVDEKVQEFAIVENACYE